MLFVRFVISELKVEKSFEIYAILVRVNIFDDFRTIDSISTWSLLMSHFLVEKTWDFWTLYFDDKGYAVHDQKIDSFFTIVGRVQAPERECWILNNNNSNLFFECVLIVIN